MKLLSPRIQLDTPIGHLRSVGPKNLSHLAKLGIKVVRDLLWHLPARYEDYSEIKAINEIEPGTKVNIQGEVIKISSRRIFPRRMTIVNAIIKDNTGAIRAVWFNQPYLADTLAEGTKVSLAGKAQLDKQGLYLSSPIYEKTTEDPLIAPVKSLTHTARLVPVYPETEGVSSKYLRFLIQPLLQTISVSDPLPSVMLDRLNLPRLDAAIQAIHYPESVEEAEQGKERLAFNDLLFFQLKALLERRKYNQLKSAPISFDKAFIQDFIYHLPFELTHDQKIATWEILQDLEKSYPMNRLLEGDVGSGKTVVALTAALQVAQKKAQSVFLAPTEVLAHQHFQTISDLTKSGKFSLGLITSSLALINGQTVSKEHLKKMIRSGEIDILIGTHAVIEKDVNFNNLALVIIDEQHRFGIEQRASLIKGERSILRRTIPHLLSMTATPIPRTLALTIFGDLDISILKEKPKDRQAIITKIILPPGRQETYEFVRNQAISGRQIFVICPRIEPSNLTESILSGPKQGSFQQLWLEVKAVEDEYARLSQIVFPDLKIAKLHGKIKPKEKQKIMQEFKERKYDVLVATSVIEVGVDIPNATVMLIEGADRFGLAQLHQFRGRIGRSSHQSYCFLIPTAADKGSRQRLKALVESNDGFTLAEKDMAIRGPGEFFGLKQSGIPDLTMAALANMELIKKARMYARLLLRGDPSLQKYPVLKQQLESFQKLHHFE